MKKYLFLSMACLMALCAMAQTIDAIKVTQGETTDWYRFGESSRIEVTIDELGNPEFPGGIMYDLSLDGNVETMFGTAPVEKITLTAADFTVTKDGDWVYDKTEKRVKVEFISVEHPGPSADKITIYYNNDKMVKPINPGTYQVYIDIEEDNTYAAVTGITSDAWKFDIIDPLPAIKEAAIAEIKVAANGAKEEIDGLGVDESAKSEAKAQIDNIANTAEQTINAATSKDAIDNAKTEAIADIYNVVQNLKDMWVTVRTDGAAGNWNTICLERNITAIDGATFWTVSGQDATSFILDEVTEPQAGYGYLIRFTKSDLKVKYGDETADNPVQASYDNPVQGTFTQIDFDQEGQNELVGNYVVYNNQLCEVEARVGLYAHRAYVVADLVPNNAPAPAPGRARAYMPKPKQTPTGLNRFTDSPTPRFTKYIKDGQLVIVKDGKKINALGM